MEARLRQDGGKSQFYLAITPNKTDRVMLLEQKRVESITRNKYMTKHKEHWVTIPRNFIVDWKPYFSITDTGFLVLLTILVPSRYIGDIESKINSIVKDKAKTKEIISLLKKEFPGILNDLNVKVKYSDET